jgi:hypothetical protein
VHFAFRAVLTEGEIGKSPFGFGEGQTSICCQKIFKKKGHQRRGLWPKTSQQMTLMRHFVCYG